MDECVVALDAGIGGGRSLICDASGHVIASVYREWTYETLPGVPGASTFDAECLWSELCVATREAMAHGGVSPQAVRAISATSQREGLVLVDGEGRVQHAMSSLDARGSAENDALARAHGDVVYRITGHHLNMVHTPGRWGWLQRHEPAVAAATRHLFMIDSWLCYRMSGEAVAEPSSASASLLFDITKRCWSPVVCALAGVREDLLPVLGESGQVIGSLRSSAAAELGLLPGTPVVLGGGDGQCGLLGLGVVDPGHVGAIAGTTTPVLMTVAEPCFDALERTWTQCHAAVHAWAVEANCGSTGLSYRWLRDLLWCLADGQPPAADAFDRMDGAAATIPAGSNGVKVYLGRRAMDLRRRELIQRTANIHGMPMDGPIAATRAAVTRAMLESIAFSMRYNCELLRDVAGQPVPALHVGGGQARSRLWREIVADVFGVPLLVGIPEVAALGAAMCAWVGAGRAADVAAVSRELARHVVVAPRAGAHERYEQIYQAWLQDWPA